MSPPLLPRINPLPGKHSDPAEGACIMEILSLATQAVWVVDFITVQPLAGLVEHGHWEFVRYGSDNLGFTDLPECTDPKIALAAQRTWDSTDHLVTLSPDTFVAVAARSNAERRRLKMLAKFLPRLLRAKRTENHRVKMRISLAACRFVEHKSLLAAGLNDLVELWLRGEATDADLHAALQRFAPMDPADVISSNDHARLCAAHAAYCLVQEALGLGGHPRDGVLAYAMSVYDHSLDRTDEYEAFLDMLLDAREKACAEEGEMLFDPEPWEADAIDFVDTLMAEVAEMLR